jgi:uncharacterized protein
MNVEVVYALPQQAETERLTLEPGTTLRAALAISRLAQTHGGETADVGLYSERVALDHVLQDGDRIEIYRALAVDPKDARRERALQSRR